MKKYIIVSLIVILCGVGVYRFYNKTAGVVGDGCNQLATTTDCAKILQLQNTIYKPSENKSQKVVLKRYFNDELGFSFSYPTLETDVSNIKTYKGDTGKAFGGEVVTVPALDLYVNALTADYSLPKDAPMGMTEGYNVKDGKYYSIVKGKPAQISFVPDEIWKLKNGAEVVVSYRYKTYHTDDLYPPFTMATVNLPYGGSFTGVTFVMNQKYKDNMYVPFTDEDFALFKRIVTSVEFEK